MAGDCYSIRMSALRQYMFAENGDMECKFWLLPEEVEIKEAFSYNLTPSARKEVKKIIYQHFDLIIES